MSQSNTNSPLVNKPPSKRVWLKALSYKPMPLLLSISVLWSIGSIVAYQMSCCFASVSSVPLSIQDGSISVASSLDNIQFSTAAAVPEMSEEVNNELIKTAKYIETHPNKLLIIKGQEWIEKEGEGLGMQRAINIKAELVKLGAPFKRMITKAETAATLESSRGKVFDGVRFEIKTLASQSLLIQSEDGFIAKARTNLSFNKNSANILHPYPNEVQKAANKVVNYLKNNPDKALIIKGWSGVSETHEYLEAIGNQRAVSLRNWWIGMGSPVSQVIILQNDKDRELSFVDNQLFGGADYIIASLADYNSIPKTTGKTNVTDEDLAKVPESVVIYFDSDSHIPKINQADAATLGVYMSYLKSNTNAKVILSGYTDDVGSPSYNLKLSGKRATSIQNYLETNEVNGNQIQIKKMGILKSTTSAADKAKSRKVELSIIK